MNASNKEWGYYSLSGFKAQWLQFLHTLPRGKVSHRLALWLRKPLKSALPEYTDVLVWGLRLRLRSRGNLSEQRLILLPQFLDHRELRALADYMSEGGVFLDIGANAGVYSLWVGSQCPGAEVEAFEPDATLCARLAYNLEVNALHHVHLHRFALGRHVGEVTLIPGECNQGQNQICTQVESGQTVPMKTLPEVLKERNIRKIRALKIDVEGMEIDVLEPLFLSTPECDWPELIICEALQQEDVSSLFDLLAQHGYRLKQRTRMNGLFYR